MILCQINKHLNKNMFENQKFEVFICTAGSVYPWRVAWAGEEGRHYGALRGAGPYGVNTSWC